jgi:hypothetical protein
MRAIDQVNLLLEDAKERGVVVSAVRMHPSHWLQIRADAITRAQMGELGKGDVLVPINNVEVIFDKRLASPFLITRDE